MNIAFLTSEYVTEPSYAGGLAQYLGRVCHELVKRGNHVEVFVSSEQKETIEINGVVVNRVKVTRVKTLRIINAALRRMGLPSLKHVERALSIAKSLRNALRAKCETEGLNKHQTNQCIKDMYQEINKKAKEIANTL